MVRHGLRQELRVYYLPLLALLCAAAYINVRQWSTGLSVFPRAL